MTAARGAGLGGVTATARSATSRGHCSGPSIATTGLPAASAAASVPLRDEAPPRSGNRTTSTAVSSAETSYAERTPVKRRSLTCAEHAAHHAAADWESG